MLSCCLTFQTEHKKVFYSVSGGGQGMWLQHGKPIIPTQTAKETLVLYWFRGGKKIFLTITISFSKKKTKKRKTQDLRNWATEHHVFIIRFAFNNIKDKGYIYILLNLQQQIRIHWYKNYSVLPDWSKRTVSRNVIPCAVLLPHCSL